MKSEDKTLHLPMAHGASGQLAERFRKISRIFPFVGARVGLWLGIMCSASLALGLVEMAVSWMLQFFLMTLHLIPITEKIAGPWGNLQPSLRQLAFALIAIGAVRAVCEFTVAHGASVSLELLSSRLRLISLYEMLRSKKEKFVSSSDMNHRLAEIFPKAALFCHYFSLLASNLIQGSVLFVFLLYTAWRHSIIGLLGLGAVGIISITFNKKVRHAARNIPREQKLLVSGVERIARNWLFVKVLRTEKNEYKRLSQHSLSYSRHYLRSSFFGNAAAVLPSALGLYLILIITAIDLKYWNSPGLAFITFLYIYLRFVQVVSRTVGILGQANAVWPNFVSAFQYFHGFDKDEIAAATAPMVGVSSMGQDEKRLETEPTHTAATKASIPQTPAALPPSIVFQNVTFSYTSQSKEILRSFDLTIPAGSQLGIIGRSGSGKSTILGLLLGLLQPTRGKIAVDGVLPKDYFSADSGGVGYVGAEPFLIEGSLRENLSYGSEAPRTDADYLEALESARLTECLQKLPGGLDFHLTENSEGLSAGEKQRLALARALLNKPKVLILDEASANLDEKTESEITLVIERLKGICTSIIVSHRPGILKNVDQLVNLQELRS